MTFICMYCDCFLIDPFIKYSRFGLYIRSYLISIEKCNRFHVDPFNLNPLMKNSLNQIHQRDVKVAKRFLKEGLASYHAKNPRITTVNGHKDYLVAIRMKSTYHAVSHFV